MMFFNYMVIAIPIKCTEHSEGKIQLPVLQLCLESFHPVICCSSIWPDARTLRGCLDDILLGGGGGRHTSLLAAGLRARSRGANITCKKKSQGQELVLHLRRFAHLIYCTSLLVGTLDMFLQKLKGVSE